MTEKVRSLHLRVPEELHRALTAIAKRERRTITATIEVAVERYIAEEEDGLSLEERLRAVDEDLVAGRFRDYTNPDEAFLATIFDDEDGSLARGYASA